MLIEISFGNERTEVDLVDGVVHVGGAESDEICVEGLPASLLTLNLVGERLMVTAAKAVSIGGVRFPAHLPRLVVPGEKMQLPAAVTLKQLLPKAKKHRSFKGTACVVRELVGNGFEVAHSRAATLTCLTGLDAGFSFPIALNETTIGRAENAAVRVRDRAVSRRHARVVRNRRQDLLEAMPDTNGLFLNGEPVTEPTALSSGDVIELGHSLLRYDGPEQALTADEKIEPTVLVAAEEIEEVAPEQIVEEVPVATEQVTATERAFPLDLVIVATGTALALIGLVVTISVCV